MTYFGVRFADSAVGFILLSSFPPNSPLDPPKRPPTRAHIRRISLCTKLDLIYLQLSSVPARSANEICAARTGRGCTSLLSNMPRSVAVWTGLEIEPEVTEVLVEADEAMHWFNAACVARVCATTIHHRQSRPCSLLQSRDRAQRRCPQGSSAPSRGVNVSSNIGSNVHGQWLIGWLVRCAEVGVGLERRG